MTGKGRLIAEERYAGATATAPSRTLVFSYDESGQAIGFQTKTTGGWIYYYYVRNLQGDVVSLYRLDGADTLAFAANYKYDPWGRILSVTDANGSPITDSANAALINPLRYRGYYYDSESGFYYLQSRYYDPAIGRFINSDGYASTGQGFLGFNMFAYCGNTPVICADPTGQYLASVLGDKTYVAPKTVQIPEYGTASSYTPSKQSHMDAVSSHDTNRRPYRGEPGSTYTAPNGDSRTYGPDGTPKHDYDHDDHGRPDKHPHDPDGGHNHDWENGVRGPAYSIRWEPIAGVALVTVCAIGIIVVAADDATGIGVADDFLFGPLGAGVGEGFAMIFR